MKFGEFGKIKKLSSKIKICNKKKKKKRMRFDK